MGLRFNLMALASVGLSIGLASAAERPNVLGVQIGMPEESAIKILRDACTGCDEQTFTIQSRSATGDAAPAFKYMTLLRTVPSPNKISKSNEAITVAWSPPAPGSQKVIGIHRTYNGNITVPEAQYSVSKLLGTYREKFGRESIGPKPGGYPRVLWVFDGAGKVALVPAPGVGTTCILPSWSEPNNFSSAVQYLAAPQDPNRKWREATGGINATCNVSLVLDVVARGDLSNEFSVDLVDHRAYLQAVVNADELARGRANAVQQQKENQAKGNRLPQL